ncbi:sugar-binding transcriptional regulator [Corynebacterium tapiri]|uniref:Sugar-binding transcriptional regulator n=1 Tax=Corynebacterium tapiri TaxID=1448266 RepID=A0A5C4U6M8_9CORY|nr:sugar-binding transcriptional regulator [Corynebacterium tapiri]TNL99315.1 sugar-binding transcriptional regulator [Corynebacterium tapiri]
MDTRDEQALRSAKLYYLSGFSQAQVADELGVSRPTVAKLLAHARDRGFVTITVNDPREARGELTDQLLMMYPALRQVHIVDAAHPDSLLDELGQAGARVVEAEVFDGACVGVSWGRTMYAIARALEPLATEGVEVVQLKGGMSYTQSTTNDLDTINLFCRALHANALTLPLPVIFDNAEVKEVVEQDRHIAHILERGRHADVAVFTVGHIAQESLPLNLGYLNDEELAILEANAVGDACSRFFDAQGAIAVDSIDRRTVGITLENLKTRPTRILVAGGRAKAQAIAVALDMGLASHLVIDRETARRIVEKHVS